ncbi:MULTISPECIES: hypothetical protein [Paenibacillus]|uniref:hypothetical protein n=1 Tax=Paenibacillus TaxID=44249 RepID=UPI00203F95AB|nr:hypothetical protein [Paenibacillus camelliae]MCM3634810.1 hypothetical protein [Paenibacillus camelliae]
MREQYSFADLNDQPELLEDLQQLEQKIEQQLGRTVNLIAFTPDSSIESDVSNEQHDPDDQSP